MRERFWNWAFARALDLTEFCERRMLAAVRVEDETAY